jgi:hypothetical protein
LNAKLRYFEFLRYKNNVYNSKRFQVFPESKMATKHFKLDSTILNALKMTSISVDREDGKASLLRGRQRPTLNRNIDPNIGFVPENPWIELFDLQRFGVDDHTALSMTTDGFGVCLSMGGEDRGDNEEEVEEDDDEEVEEEEEQAAEEEEGRRQDGEDDASDDADFIDIRNFEHGLFKLEKLNALPLAWTLRDVEYIGVDPGLKSVVTAVRSDDPNDKLEITSGIH